MIDLLDDALNMTVLPNHLSDFIPDSTEKEATQNGNGDYIMTEIHETTFDMKFKSDRVCLNELPGVFPPAKLDFSNQDKQVILGLRENSIEAFWIQDGIRERIQNRNDLDRSEYVNIKTTETTVEIKFMFDDLFAAVSHFEFTFKPRI